jgi:hypothetical protein
MAIRFVNNMFISAININQHIEYLYYIITLIYIVIVFSRIDQTVITVYYYQYRANDLIERLQITKV